VHKEPLAKNASLYDVNMTV